MAGFFMRGRMGGMEPISVEQIEAVLLADGRKPDDYFLVGGAPMFWGRLGGYVCSLYNLIENDALYGACIEYLRERGVKEYANPADVSLPPVEN
jgi:hypothetical protein